MIALELAMVVWYHTSTKQWIWYHREVMSDAILWRYEMRIVPFWAYLPYFLVSKREELT